MANKKLKKARDYNAMDACLRSGGPMKDRREPRGGAKNTQEEYLADFVCDFCEEPVNQVRRVFIDGEYERVKAKALYACEKCSEEKDRQRLGL